MGFLLKVGLMIDPSDCALISLLPFLETLVDADDVRPIIAKKFGNKE